MNPIPAAHEQPAVADRAPLDAIDVDLERDRTLGSRLSTHVNAAGSALPSTAVVGAVVDHLRLEEESGGYEAAAATRPRLEAVYASAAALVGARAEEIALLDSASTGLRVILEALRPSRGQQIIATRSTYVSHALHLMTLARDRDVQLSVLPSTAAHAADLDALESLLRTGPPAIVTAAHIPTSSGLIEPAAEIGALVRRYGGVFVLDATQSVGQLDVSVDRLQCDVLVTTGRKFLRAPRGTGFAYVAAPLIDRLAPAAPDVRAARWDRPDHWELDVSARRFETWESSVAARLGLGVAIDEAMARGLPLTESWLSRMATRLRTRLAEIDGVALADPPGCTSAIVTFTIDALAAAEAVAELAARRVHVVSVPATHGQWDLGDRGLPAVVRASVHVYNDENDVASLVDGVRHLAEGARTGAL
ncbi:aminotransferase class V-fold PLP-dependent enzyme [Microbacterium sp. NPDC091313]